MSRAASKRAGESVESAVVQRLDALEPVVVRDAHIDARATSAIWPSTVPTVGLAVVESGTDVEIKSCSVVVTDAQDRGRFYLRETQHNVLLDRGGVYLFAVTPTHDDRPLALKFVPAAVISEAVPSWHDLDGRETYARLTWSRVFDSAEIDPDAGGGLLMGGRLEYCPSPQCGVECFVEHPAGWRCTSCSTCVSEFQQPLARFGGGDQA